MDSGFYTASVGMLNQFNAENNIADNLANLQTTGYKGRTPVIEDFSQVLMSSQDGPAPSPVSPAISIGRMGEAPQIQSYGLDLAQGTPRHTGSVLDAMIVGNSFFTVRSGNQTLLTRDGNFRRSADGTLVTNAGYTVLNAAGKPIKLPQGTLTIERSGALTVDGVHADRLGLARVPVGKPLSDAGGGYFVGPGTPLPAGVQGVAVLQGYLEGSNVDMATQTTAMIAAQRAYQADSRMLQMQDDTLGLAANDLGKVTG